MVLNDIAFIFQWWLAFFIVGIVFLPLTFNLFHNFFDKGYIFAKILGAIAISYLIFILGIAHILSFTRLNLFVILTFILLLDFVFIKLSKNLKTFFLSKEKILMFFIEEVIFLTGITSWSFIRAHQADIQGLEKFMDFGFINSILRSDYFPPRDMWFTPFSINYYYFGHLVTAVLTKLSNIPSPITYNLMLSTIFAFTFTASFSIGANLFYFLNLKNISEAKTIIAGLLTAFLVSFAGNLHTIYSFFTPYANENPVPVWQLIFSPQSFPNSYWYPNATRFIHNTIHEFPLYSFVVSDLHGHVLDIPLVLMTIALLLSALLKQKRQSYKLKSQNSKVKTTTQNAKLFSFKLIVLGFEFYVLSFLLAVMYMTNAWDGIIYFLLTALVLLYLNIQQYNAVPQEIKNSHPDLNQRIKIRTYRWLFQLFIIGTGFALFSLPFSLNFKPFVSGIGILCAPKLLTDIGKIGPFLFEANHCQKSPLWQLITLYGFFYFWAIIFLIKLKMQKAKIKNLQSPDLFVLILIFLSTLLIIVPEFIYAKDIYPAHYRANTMFKLVYQSFIMLSIASGYIIVRLILFIKQRILDIFNFYFVFLIFSFLFFILVMIYPYFAINSYYGNLKKYYGLDGIAYLNRLYPTDYQAILWLNKNIKGQPVILEAQGDSYTDYARISANTGLPTVLGWTVHEWLWRGTYDIPAPRINEVKTLYETEDINQTKNLIRKYNISLVFIGDLERQKYQLLDEQKFEILGKIIYQKGQTKIYKITVKGSWRSDS